ncbi:hypothetical protein [Microvirga pakistanensis]|uniref:hypothetical protein n=1 Tax=Microvirga pakistanensis TaxID=1682650 RepID=UPI00106B5016|nr:hypothetical protein [Microvirga pakistanensis]
MRGITQPYSVYFFRIFEAVAENIVSVDGILVNFAENLERLNDLLLATTPGDTDAARTRNLEVRKTAQYIRDEAEQLATNAQYVNNPLIVARLKGIEFEWIRSRIGQVTTLLRAQGQPHPTLLHTIDLAVTNQAMCSLQRLPACCW